MNLTKHRLHLFPKTSLFFDSPVVLNFDEHLKFWLLFSYAIITLQTSFVFNTPVEIISGMKKIILTESILLSDYIILANPGASFFNSGTLMLICLIIVKKCKLDINGSIIAALFTVAGFAFFGKNVFNVWPVLAGVYLYTVLKKEHFNHFILVAFFGTALSPLVSLVSFGMGFDRPLGIILGICMGVIAGFVLPPLANHMVKFHQGYNIYNIGFTAGMVGTLFMALLRSFGLKNEAQYHVATNMNNSLGLFLIIMFISMISLGFIFNGFSFSGFKRLFSYSGRLVTDFVTNESFDISLINMGLMGVIATSYVLLVGGDINGPVIGGIFTIVGFAAFGKQPLNTIPILFGVFLACQVQSIEVASPTALLAALFGTTLAPIAGKFGFLAGIFAAFMHTAMVMNVGYLHGGINLYNNGFAGGLVAAMLVPFLNSFTKEVDYERN